jgi:cyclopropane-fatty-acyl-phospholipid synthase
MVHARSRPLQHTFTYPFWMLAVDLDALDELDRSLRLFGRNRRRPVSIHDGDYLGDGAGSLRGKLERRLGAAGVAAPRRITLVTMPRVLGHVFNPVSFYYCYDGADRLTCCVAEVNNTFGEGHVYVLDTATASTRPPDSEIAGPRPREELSFRVPKEFHVSPFNDMAGDYDFGFGPLGSGLDVRIDLWVDGSRTLATRLRGSARPLSDGALLRTLLRYPFSVALTVPRILRQAASLYFRRGLRFHPKPDPSSPRTFRGTRPAYISELRLPPALEKFARRPTEPSGESG